MKSPRNGTKEINRGRICDVLPRSSISLSLTKLSKPTNIPVCHFHQRNREDISTRQSPGDVICHGTASVRCTASRSRQIGGIWMLDMTYRLIEKAPGYQVIGGLYIES